MVVKIQQSHGTMQGTLDYNQNKVAKGDARILAIYNMEGETTRRGIERVFERYERRNIRTEKVSFQMSINPDPDRPGEKLTDSEACEYARDILRELGYENQPVVIFEHRDIERAHYHVVSIRTNAQGRKIKDNFEKEKLQKILHKYQEKYHYSVGNENEKKQESIKPQEATPAKEKTARLPRFNPGTKDVNKQYEKIFEAAMEYDFRTIVQFQTIMRSMGVNPDVWESDSPYFILEGLDKNGEVASPRVSEKDIPSEMYTRFKTRLEQNIASGKSLSQEEKKRRYAMRRRLGETVAFALKYAKTERHFQKILEKKGISITLSRDLDMNIFGATFVDHKNKTAFKASELKADLDMEVLKSVGAPKTGAWAKNEEILLEEWKKRKAAERAEARIQRNLDLSVLAANIPPPQLQIKTPKRTAFASELEYTIALLAAQLIGAIFGLKIRPYYGTKKRSTPTNKKAYS